LKSSREDNIKERRGRWCDEFAESGIDGGRMKKKNKNKKKKNKKNKKVTSRSWVSVSC